MMTTLLFSTSQFRSLPNPSDPSAKVALFIAPARSVPPELRDWLDVNPREVSTKTAVYRGIVETLRDEPDRFFERNRGLTISAEDVRFDDKRKQASVVLSDRKLHGLIDGGHTITAILQAAADNQELPANVFVKVVTGVSAEQVAEIAGGLNTSQQVDLKSLQNLEGNFNRLKKKLAGEPYADRIAYKMNEPKPIDVREVLYYLTVFDCDKYDDNVHPSSVFGRKEELVRRFAAQAEAGSGSFDVLISRAPEILELRDLIEKKILEENVGRYKSDRNNRIRSQKHLNNHLQFLDEDVDGKVSLGWVLPMLGAFRANVIWNRPKGSFTWKVDNDLLLHSCMPRLLAAVKEIHDRENGRPEYVGRNATTWRACYDTVKLAILEIEIKKLKE